MRSLTFHGGVHPPQHKQETMDSSIREFPAPELLTVSLSQHIGAPSEPLVKVGDRVLMGQKIGDSPVTVTAPVHSPVSGTVEAITDTPLPNGRTARAIVIRNDFEDTPDPSTLLDRKLTDLTPEEIVSVIEGAGIVGMGGASFPTHVKLNPNKPIDTVVVNGAECEPYLTNDYQVMLTYGKEITGGLEAILYRFGIKNGVIGVEDNKPKAIETLKPLLKEGMKVKKLKTKYPQGSEKQLIWALTHREVPSGGLPADVGVAVVNVSTCVAIYNAVRYGKPLTRRVVTVTGSAVENPGNFLVRVGTPVSALLEAAGLKEEPAKIISGGPMMGFALYTAEVPIIKSSGGIVALTKKDVAPIESEPCIRCGQCVRACPMGLSPVTLTNFSQLRDYDMCEKLDIMSCMECGTCAYLCPSRRYPLQYIKLAKAAISEKRRKEKK